MMINPYEFQVMGDTGDNILTEISNKITLEINNEIEAFVIRAIESTTGNEKITINADSIKQAISRNIPSRVVTKEEIDPGVDGGFPIMFVSKCCPKCGHRLGRWCNYCYSCGQKIDWSEYDN